jgi:iron complex transport system substrate-binding protein
LESQPKISLSTGKARRAPLRTATLALGALSVVLCAASAHAWPGQRIVSLAPSITETLFAIGAGDEVVGVSQYCDYPPQVVSLPKVGSFLTPNIEAIVGLRPALIIGLDTSSNDREIRALQRMGYRVLLVNDNSLAGIEDGIQKIGVLTGHTAQALQLLNSIHTRMRTVRERLKGVAPRKVLMVVGHDPLVAVGGGYLDQLLQMADCINIASAMGAEWPRLSLEYIIAAAPEVILDGQMGSDPATPSGFWSRYRTIPAVRYHRLSGYPQSLLHPGPRIGQTLEILASLTHPEIFPATTLKDGSLPGRPVAAGERP